MGTGQRELLGKRGGPERSWIGTTGAAGPAAQEDENINKQYTIVGYVSEYGRFYGEMSVRYTGGGTSDPFRKIQYPEQLERGHGIHPALNVPGQHGLGSIPGD